MPSLLDDTKSTSHGTPRSLPMLGAKSSSLLGRVGSELTFGDLRAGSLIVSRFWMELGQH